MKIFNLRMDQPLPTYANMSWADFWWENVHFFLTSIAWQNIPDLPSIFFVPQMSEGNLIESAYPSPPPIGLTYLYLCLRSGTENRLTKDLLKRLQHPYSLEYRNHFSCYASAIDWYLSQSHYNYLVWNSCYSKQENFVPYHNITCLLRLINEVT